MITFSNNQNANIVGLRVVPEQKRKDWNNWSYNRQKKDIALGCGFGLIATAGKYIANGKNHPKRLIKSIDFGAYIAMGVIIALLIRDSIIAQKQLKKSDNPPN